MVCGLQTSDSDQTLGDSKRVQRKHKPEITASEGGMFELLLYSYNYNITVMLASHMAIRLHVLGNINIFRCS